MNLLTLRNEQYDDLDLDRPTCSSGASKRIISSLFYHPLLESEFISAKTMLEQFIGDVMFEHIKSQITLEDYQFIFDAVRNPEELSHEDLSKLKRLNLEMSKKMDFVNKINNKFPNSAVPWIYKQLINHAFTTNNNCHVLTCSAKIQNLANDIIALIKNIINKQVLIVIEGDVSVNVNNSSIKRRWCEIYEENSEYPEALKDMEFSQKMSEMEKIIGECDIEDDLKAKFDEKLPDNGLEDAFYSELQNYILGITTHENPKAFLETWFKKTYDVFNWDTFSNLQQDWILRDLLDKVRRFTDAVPSNRYLFSELNPLIKRIHSRLEILSKKTSEASNNNTFSTIGLSR